MSNFNSSRRCDDPNRRPSIANSGGEAKTIHRTCWHIYVGENNRDVITGLENPYGLVGVGGVDYAITRVLDDVDRVHPNQYLIFDDKNDMPLQMPYF